MRRPLTLAIAAPWYIWADVQTDHRLWQVFFWHHNVERFAGTSINDDRIAVRIHQPILIDADSLVQIPLQPLIARSGAG